VLYYRRFIVATKPTRICTLMVGGLNIICDGCSDIPRAGVEGMVAMEYHLRTIGRKL